MPNYTYECAAGHRFVDVEPIDASPERSCEVDGCNEPAQRVIGAPAGRVRGGTPNFHGAVPKGR